MQAVRYMMSKQGFQNIIVYLDDFLAISATQVQCTRAYKGCVTIIAGPGFYHQRGQTSTANAKLTFLGIELVL